MQVGTKTFIIVTFFLFLCKFSVSSVSNVIDDKIVEDASPVAEKSSWGYWQLSGFVGIITGMTPGDALIDYSVFSEGWCTQHKYNIEVKYGISEKNPGPEESQNLLKTHIPNSEFKPLLKINSSNGNNVIYLNRRNIPRSELNSLPLEPFQRVMTYAIEFNLIPDMWFLELIYCLYYSVSTYLDGIAMSYTLQEILSSALLTLDYKTGSFLIERCFSSVRRFNDDKISSKYVEICNSMFKCLDSKKFLSPESSELSKTLAIRIENTYKQYFTLKNLDGTFDHKLFGKYSLLLSISIFNNKKRSLSMYSLEKNYLVISSMNASLALRLLAISVNCPVSECSDSNIVELGYKIVNSVKDLANEFAIQKCIYLLFSSTFFKSAMKIHMASEFCVGLLSLGFINEKITVPSGIDLNLLSKAVMPYRITYPHYLGLVPVISVVGHDEFSLSNWIEDYKAVDLGKEDGDGKLIRKKVFTLRKVSSRTSKAAVKSRMVKESLDFKINKTGKSKFKTGLTRLKRSFLGRD
ncbi:hypothetical protein FG379_000502 [Cryptosporidium bovis]|uniref:uncharacterized protein n=1 Tax=Cryptosporidium bovis TaxID=310047 RepID=UPI00351A85A0|nr:hypothetical protein FG379_000502 [Cryptosporidium bovis]